MDNPAQSITPPSKRSLFTTLFLASIPVTTGVTVVLSFIVLRYTYGGPGMGFLIAPFAYLTMVGAGNLLVSAVLAFGFGHKLNRQRAISILIVLNLLFLLISSGLVITDYSKKSSAGQKQEQKQAREEYLADNANDVTQCNEITGNFYYWQRCLDSTRRQPSQTRSLEERLTICLQQAQQKSFAYQPEALTKTCQDRFSGAP